MNALINGPLEVKVDTDLYGTYYRAVGAFLAQISVSFHQTSIITLVA